MATRAAAAIGGSAGRLWADDWVRKTNTAEDGTKGVGQSRRDAGRHNRRVGPQPISLHYRYEEPGAKGLPTLAHPLYALLEAVWEQGSISHAAASLRLSYRHVWGSLKEWESRLGQPLVDWTQGRKAELTPWALELLWRERLSRARSGPELQRLRWRLSQVTQPPGMGGVGQAPWQWAHDGGPAWWALQQQLGAPWAVALEPRLEWPWPMALDALVRGRLEAVSVGLPLERDAARGALSHFYPGEPPVGLRLLSSHRQAVGWMALHARTLEELPVSLSEAATALADEGWLRPVVESGLCSPWWGLTQAPGPLWEEPNDTACAVQVASGAVSVAWGTPQAAQTLGLAYRAVAVTRHWVAVPEAGDAAAAARAVALESALLDPQWALTLQSVGGLGAERAGQWQSWAQALR